MLAEFCAQKGSGRTAAVQIETEFQGRLNVGFQCRGMVGSRTQLMAAIRPSCRDVHGAAFVTSGTSTAITWTEVAGNALQSL